MRNLDVTTKKNIGIHDVSEFKEIGTGRVTTGDSVLEDVQIDFIKIDVEGFELHCLHGLRGAIARCKPAIFVEVTEETKEEVVELLKKMGYVIRNTYSRYEGVENILMTPDCAET